MNNLSAKKGAGAAEEGYLADLKAFFEQAGDFTLFSLRYFREFFSRPFEFKEALKQSYLVGYQSFGLVSLTGFIMGLVLTIQSRPTMAEFGAVSWIPSMVAISIVREIGPVITALIFAGKVGSGIGAELASMKVTEQIDAMEVSGTNPYKYTVVTRILSTTLMLPLLVVVANAIAIYGSYVGMNLKDSVGFTLFFMQVFEKLSFADLLPATIKTFFFGFAIGAISCYKGYTARNGTEGVGAAANAAVVASSICIFILDMIAVQLTSFFS